MATEGPRDILPPPERAFDGVPQHQHLLVSDPCPGRAG